MLLFIEMMEQLKIRYDDDETGELNEQLLYDADLLVEFQYVDLKSQFLTMLKTMSDSPVSGRSSAENLIDCFREQLDRFVEQYINAGSDEEAEKFWNTLNIK